MSDYEWRRSSFCASGACVDVRRDGDTIVVRDGKLGDRSIEQTFSLERWPQLLSALTNGEDHPDVQADDGYVRLGRVTPLFFTADEWNAFVKGVKNGEFEIERLSSGEAGSGFRGVARSGQAATGAGAIAVPPVPVAADRQIATIKTHFTRRIDTLKARAERAERELEEARAEAATLTDQLGDMRATVSAAEADRDAVAAQPRYVLDAPAILDLAGRYAAACVEAATSGSPKGREDAREQIRDLWDAICAALTPVPDVEPEPAWGSGPLVEHVTETPADPKPLAPSYPAGICRCGADGHGPGDNLCVCRSAS